MCASLHRRTSLPPLFLIRTATSSSLQMDTSKGEDADVALHHVPEFEQTALRLAAPHRPRMPGSELQGPPDLGGGPTQPFSAPACRYVSLN